jgi:hypothetical protein
MEEGLPNVSSQEQGFNELQEAAGTLTDTGHWCTTFAQSQGRTAAPRRFSMILLG